MRPSDESQNEAAAFLSLVGTIMVGIGVGLIFGAPFGWLFLGLMCIVVAVLGRR